VITSLNEHQLLVFWVELFSLLLVARVLGGLMRRLGQPAVIGELAAGLVLGPSIFGKIWPDGFEWFLPGGEAQSAALLAVGWIGVILLLVITGFETDLGLVRRNGRAAAMVAGGGQVIPFAMGLAVGYLIPESFIGDEATRLVFALFIATALSISALPVIASVLRDLGMMRRDFAQITLAAGMADDVVGWLLLGVISSLAAAGKVSVSGLTLAIGGLLIFLVGSLTLGQRGVDALLKRVRSGGRNVAGAMTVSLLVALGAAVVTQALHVEAVFGAFVAGMVLGRSRFQQEEVVEHIEAMTRSFFAPIFFATAGLRVDLEALFHVETLFWTAVVILIACLGKLGGVFLGSRLARLSVRDGLAIGAGMNARGALEIIVATVGYSIGVLSPAAYTIIVMVALTTSALAPPMLRWFVKDWRGTKQEQERLDREDALSRNIVVRDRRILLPSRGRPGSIAAAQVLHFAWPAEAGVTVLCIGDADADLSPVANVFDEREVDLYHSSAEQEDVVNRVLLECNLNYGVLGIGVADVADTDPPLPPLVNELVNESPLPVVLVRAPRNLETSLPGAFTRALVPLEGGVLSRAAQEVAFNIHRQLGTEIILTHIATVSTDGGWHAGPISLRLTPSVADQMVKQAVTLADEMRVPVQTRVERNPRSPGAGIVEAAATSEADLVVIGARSRRLEGRPYLGSTVEYVLRNCDATVVVVVVPETGAE
jgi:Kef-type K+ transport system membrane component KefB/nucleotide-binding universal stress UspA family protein